VPPLATAAPCGGVAPLAARLQTLPTPLALQQVVATPRCTVGPCVLSCGLRAGLCWVSQRGSVHVKTKTYSSCISAFASNRRWDTQGVNGGVSLTHRGVTRGCVPGALRVRGLCKQTIAHGTSGPGFCFGVACGTPLCPQTPALWPRAGPSRLQRGVGCSAALSGPCRSSAQVAPAHKVLLAPAAE